VGDGTVDKYLSAVRNLHVVNGAGEPFVRAARLKLVRRALRRTANRKEPRIAVTADMLRPFLRTEDLRKYEDMLFLRGSLPGLLRLPTLPEDATG
jgi:hypothetical protein